jgi:hypothetical protein
MPAPSSATLVNWLPPTSLSARSRTYRAVVAGKRTICRAVEFGNVPLATVAFQLVPSADTYTS